MVLSELRQKPHLSASSIGDYIECGLLYKFGRIDRLPMEFVADAMEFGSVIHVCLAEYYQAKMTGDRLTLKDIHERFRHHWHRVAECLFAGDASDTCLERIAETTKNYCNDILHASHHGSLNGAELDFIKKANSKYTLISTKSGVYDNVPHPTALKRYKNHTDSNVRRTDVDGWWQWTF